MNFDMEAFEVAIEQAFVTLTHQYPDESAEFAWYDLEDYLYGNHSALTIDGFGVLSQEVFDTGGEGHGENVYMIFKLVNDNGIHFFKKEGYYASHHGTDWDGPFSQVTPVERMVIFYE